MAREVIAGYLSVAKEEYDVYRRSAPRKFSHFVDHYDIDLAIHPHSASAQTKLRLFTAILREVKKITAMRGVELLVLIQPSVIDLTENVTLTYRDLQAYPDYRRDNLSTFVDKACLELGISRLNLFTVFQDNVPSDLYFKGGNDHWNELGQDLSAKATASYIEDNMLQGRVVGRDTISKRSTRSR